MKGEYKTLFKDKLFFTKGSLSLSIEILSVLRFLFAPLFSKKIQPCGVN